MGHLQFLTQKKFYVNLIIIILLCLVMLWLTSIMLRGCTRHGKEFAMPDFIGQDINEVMKSNSRKLNFIVVDSVYPKGQTPGSIVQQDPLPDSKVKRGRNVYCIVVANTPEKTTMPNLNNLSLRQGINLLEASGLEVDQLVYVEYFAKNAIVKQMFKGNIIEPGTEIGKGSGITLHVGIGDDHANVKIPNLIGVHAEEAKRLLNLAGLNMGHATYEDLDSIQHMCVVKMQPGPFNKVVAPGTSVNLWYKSDRKIDFKKEMNRLLMEDSIFNMPTLTDSLEMVGDTAVNSSNNDYEDEF